MILLCFYHDFIIINIDVSPIFFDIGVGESHLNIKKVAVLAKKMSKCMNIATKLMSLQ